jgi:ACS family glucarate transporter-like MFS transporter
MPPPSDATRYRWTLAYLLLVVTTHAFATRFSMSVVAQQIQSEAGLTNAQVGSTLSAFIIGYAVMQFPVGILVDRLGAFRLLTASVFGWSLFTLASAALIWLPSSLWVTGLFITRLLSGACQASVLTATIKMLGRWMPAGERSSANGLSLMGLGLGGALSPPLVVWMIGLGGWAVPFWVFGASGLLVAAVLAKSGREWPGEHPLVNSAELALIRDGATAEPAKTAGATPWRLLFSSVSVWGLILSYGIAAYTSYVFFTWFYLYLVNVRGMTKTAGGYWAGLPYVAVSIGTVAGGRLSDWLTLRYGKRTGRLLVVLAGEGLAALLIVLGGRIDNVTLAIPLLALAAGLHLFGQTSSWAAAVDIAPQHAGALFGLMNTVAQVTGAIAPIATPFIALHFGWTSALDFSAGLVTLAGLLWLVVRPDRPVTR